MTPHSQALVSIVIPVYNAEAFLADAINSCLDQSYRPIEIICVENNSGDKSRDLLKHFKKSYPGIINLYEERQPGAPAARNKGMAVARGEFIHFLDADDVLYPNAICSLIMGMEAGVDAVCGSESYFDNDFSGSLQFERLRIKNYDYQVSDILANHPNTGAVLLRKSSIKKVRWDNSLRASQELVFWIDLCVNNNARFKYIQARVCKIRLHSSATRISNKPKKERAFLRYMAILKMETLLGNARYKTEAAAIAFNDFLLKHAFSSISARNFKVSGLIAKKIDKQLIYKSPGFKPVSREGITYVSNHYFGFLFHFLNSRIAGKF